MLQDRWMTMSDERLEEKCEEAREQRQEQVVAQNSMSEKKKLIIPGGEYGQPSQRKGFEESKTAFGSLMPAPGNRDRRRSMQFRGSNTNISPKTPLK